VREAQSRIISILAGNTRRSLLAYPRLVRMQIMRNGKVNFVPFPIKKRRTPLTATVFRAKRKIPEGTDRTERSKR